MRTCYNMVRFWCVVHIESAKVNATKENPGEVGINPAIYDKVLFM